MNIINKVYLYRGKDIVELGCIMPVYPVMLDALTEKHYYDDDEDPIEDPILLRVGKSQNVTISVEIYLNNGCLDEEKHDHELVYAIGIAGENSGRAEFTLMNILQIEEEKFRRQLAFGQPSYYYKFYYRDHTREYFEMKIQNVMK